MPFINYVIPGLQAAGYKVLGNEVGEYYDDASYKIYGRSLVDGAVYEQGAVNWWSSGGGWLTGSVISNRVMAVHDDPLRFVWVDDGGLRNVINGQPNPDLEQKRLVSLAYYYIAIPADQSRHSYHHAYDWTDYWYSMWNFYIGTPAEDRVSVPASDGTQYAWSRKYTQGIVLLNYGAATNSTATVQFTLDKAYVDANGTNYGGTVTLSPHTGLILQSAGR